MRMTVRGPKIRNKKLIACPVPRSFTYDWREPAEGRLETIGLNQTECTREGSHIST